MTAHSAIKSGGAFKRADVVLITDADDSPPVDRVEAMREEGIEVSLVQIGRNRNQDAEEDDVINVAMYARACRVTDEQIASGNFDAAEDVFI
jgi:hypothetical protein